MNDKCDQDVYKNGRSVLVIGDGFPATQIETFVQEVAAKSGQKVDWHYIAGRANIKAKAKPDGLAAVDRVIYGCPDEVGAWYKEQMLAEGRVQYKDYVERCHDGLLQALMGTKQPFEVTHTIEYSSPLYGYHPGGENHWARDPLDLTALNLQNKAIDGDERQAVPVVISWICPKCQERCHRNYTEKYYFSHHMFNKVFESAIHCSKCDHEVRIFVKLGMSLSLHASLEPEEESKDEDPTE